MYVWKINKSEKISIDEFEIHVGFIKPEYFRNELITLNIFTIRETSRILGEGKII